MVPAMDFQFGRGPERLVAVVALERPFARVDQSVPHERVFPEESLPAMLAREAHAFVVEVVVFQEASPRGEALLALVAGERR